MRKLNLIIENIKDEYMINLLEEGTSTELETLKTKKFLNESLGRVYGMLIEEGVMDSVKNHLGNNWGKYLAAAGTAGLGAHGAHVLGLDAQDFKELGQEVHKNLTGGTLPSFASGVAGVTGTAGGLLGAGAADLAAQANNAIGNAYDTGKEFVGNLVGSGEPATAPVAPAAAAAAPVTAAAPEDNSWYGAQSEAAPQDPNAVYGKTPRWLK